MMSRSIVEKLADAGNTVAGVAKSVGNKIAQGAEKAVDAVVGPTVREGDDLGIQGISEDMRVIASCGKQVGVVDKVDLESIKLTRKDSPDDQHHYIPLSWVAHVDKHVHLDRNSKETAEGWKSGPDSCGCGISS